LSGTINIGVGIIMGNKNTSHIKYTATIPRHGWDLYQKVRPGEAIYDFLVEFLSIWGIPEIAIPSYPDQLANMEVTIDRDGVLLVGHLLREHLSAHAVATDNLVLVASLEWRPMVSLRQNKLH